MKTYGVIKFIAEFEKNKKPKMLIELKNIHLYSPQFD